LASAEEAKSLGRVTGKPEDASVDLRVGRLSAELLFSFRVADNPRNGAVLRSQWEVSALIYIAVGIAVFG
jgi:hypothetical protein